MSPTLNRSSALERFECSNVIELHNEIMFDFYPGLPHVLVTCMCYCIEDVMTGLIVCMNEQFIYYHMIPISKGTWCLVNVKSVENRQHIPLHAYILYTYTLHGLWELQCSREFLPSLSSSSVHFNCSFIMFCAWDSSHHFSVPPVQLMRPGIDQNMSHTVDDFTLS